MANSAILEASHLKCLESPHWERVQMLQNQELYMDGYAISQDFEPFMDLARREAGCKET
jgi:hypothetical protein